MHVLSVIRPKEPNNNLWFSKPIDLNTGYPAYVHSHRRLNLTVISAAEVPEGEPEYHVSISQSGGRCSKAEALMVVKQFDMEGAKEDNHSSVIRSYWMPVADKNIGIECPCKENETSIIEGDFEYRPLVRP